MTGSPPGAPDQGRRRPDRRPAALSTIASRAHRTNLERAAALRAALDLASVQELDHARWTAAERTAHQLAGSAGTFGYPTASELARALEHFLTGVAQNGGGRPDPGHLSQARRLVDQLVDQLAGEPDLD